jgi:hypothetical protein
MLRMDAWKLVFTVPPPLLVRSFKKPIYQGRKIKVIDAKGRGQKRQPNKMFVLGSIQPHEEKMYYGNEFAAL